MGVRTPAPIRARRISGVHPMVSSTDSYGVRCWGCCILLLSPLRVPELNRLQERRRDGGTAAHGRRVTELRNRGQRRRVERWITARLSHAGRFGYGCAVRVYK